MKIAVFGGSFDPVHNGHVQLAEAAINELTLDLILLMPAYIQPFKRDRRAEFSKDRINMLNLAFTGFEHCKVSSYEINKGGISYRSIRFVTCAGNLKMGRINYIL